MILEDDKRLSYLPLEKATIPPQGIIEHIKDHYWTLHPTKGLVFFNKHSPQCNANESLARRLQEGMYPWAELRFISSVFRSINLQDYC